MQVLFLNIQIIKIGKLGTSFFDGAKVFDSKEEAYKEGFKEPTYYEHKNYEVLGKSLDMYHMVFAACKKEA